MSLVQYDLFGNVRDKVKRAVDILQCFCPPEGFYLAYSGGKDSIVAEKICEIAGVPYDTHYNVTTVDPPELVRFIISQFDAVVYEYSDGRPNRHFVVKDSHLSPGVIEHGNVIYFNIPQYTMRELIVKKQFPPTRMMRYCCEELKEVAGEGRVVVTGVRSAESRNRKQNQGMVTMPNKKTAKVAKENNANFSLTVRGGVLLNYDDAASRRTVEQCYRTHKTMVNPIIDFTDEDVWEFIKLYDLPYCSLYDEGFKRLGCVGCPLGGYASQRREFERWPHYKKLYTSAFDEMLKARIERGLTTKLNWQNGEDVMRWWLGYDQNNNPEQITFDDIAE